MFDSYDAIVIGGGPGGSTASTMLAKAGRKVLLLERERFPRYHIGESLLSATTDLLNKLGVLEKMDNAKFIKKHGVTWIWGTERTPWTVYFKEALATPYTFGYQVERAHFDKMLLDNAREHGVTVKEECSVTGLRRDNGRVVGVEYDSPTETKQVADATWTIDASGQSNFITKQAAQKTWDSKLRNMALWSYWKDAYRGEGDDRGNTFLPTFSDGWWWFIPLRDEITSVGVVLDRENYAAAKKHGLQDYYSDAIQKTPELRDRLRPAKMIEEMKVTMDWSYSYDSFYGPGHIAVGDAACFIDPLLSTGVHLAILSGYLCAVTINTLLLEKDKSEDQHRVLSFYQDQYSREFGRMKEQIYFLYGGHRAAESYFWHARKAVDIPGAQPKAAFASLIAGAYEHRAWYRHYLNNLDVPEPLRRMAEAIFSGKAAGDLSVNVPLVQNPMWKKMASYAIDGLQLRPTEILSPGDGRSLPLTEALSTALSHLDGRKSLLDIIESVPDDGDNRRASVRSAVNEAVTYGAIMVNQEVLAGASKGGQ